MDTGDGVGVGVWLCGEVAGKRESEGERGGRLALTQRVALQE